MRGFEVTDLPSLSCTLWSSLCEEAYVSGLLSAQRKLRNLGASNLGSRMMTTATMRALVPGCSAVQESTGFGTSATAEIDAAITGLTRHGLCSRFNAWIGEV